MVHPIFLVEGYVDSFDKFEKFWHGRIYAKGKAKLRMRKLQLYCPSINECGYEEFLSDFKSFCHIGKFDHKSSWKNTKQTGQGAKNKVRFFTKILRFLFPQLKDLEKDLEKVKNNNLKQKEAKKGNHFLVCSYPIGKILDARYEDGTEVV